MLVSVYLSYLTHNFVSAPMDVDEPEQEHIRIDSDDQDEIESYTHLDEETLIDNHNAVSFAPGEGEIPLPMWIDDNCEELAFPHIFGGHPRNVTKLKKPLSYNEIVKSELCRTDRRAAEPDHLLFVHKKIQLYQLSNGINIQLKKAAQTNVTAAQARSDGWVSEVIAKDNAFRTLQNITGSPAYWEHQKKNVLAMVRQFGICSFFVTLSAAETKWKELLKILLKTKEGLDADDAYIDNLPFE